MAVSVAKSAVATDAKFSQRLSVKISAGAKNHQPSVRIFETASNAQLPILGPALQELGGYHHAADAGPDKRRIPPAQ